MFDFDKNGKMDFMEFAIGTGMFDPNSPFNKQDYNSPYNTNNELPIIVSDNSCVTVNRTQDTLYWDDGTFFTGEIRNGVCWNGNGTVKYNTGDTYCGEVRDGKQCGHGVYYWSDGSSFVGEFFNGQCWTGSGTIKYANGDVYVGEKRNGKNHGYGIKYIVGYGTIESEWQNDEMHGHGAVHEDDGCYFVGEFRNGQMWNGKAKIKGDNEFNEGQIKEGRWEYFNIISF